MKTVAILIPCFNESQTIKKVVTDYRAVLPDADIYVYDNNSTDGTADVARASGAIVRYERKQGKGNVIRTMFREIEADCYLMIDGDDTYPASNAKELVSKILDEGYDMAIGDRLSSTYFVENKRPFHNTGNVLVRKLVNSFFKGNVTDIMTGYRAFSRIFVKSFPILSKGFEIETEMTIHALDKNFSIISVPVSYRDRPQGSISKLNTISDGFKVLVTIARLFKDYKPLAFFGVLSAVMMAVAFGLLFPILREYQRSGMVPQLPTFIAACFMAMFSLQTFVCGLVPDTEGKKSRQSFEIQMNMLQELADEQRDLSISK